MSVTLIVYFPSRSSKYFFFLFRITFLEAVTHFCHDFFKTNAPKGNSFFNFVAIYHILNHMTEPFGQRERDPKCIKWIIRNRDQKFKLVLPFGKIPSK